MKATELTVEVIAKLTITDEMANRCLRLLEFWQNDNPNKHIVADTVLTTDGKRTLFRIKEDDET